MTSSSQNMLDALSRSSAVELYDFIAYVLSSETFKQNLTQYSKDAVSIFSLYDPHTFSFKEEVQIHSTITQGKQLLDTLAALGEEDYTPTGYIIFHMLYGFFYPRAMSLDHMFVQAMIVNYEYISQYMVGCFNDYIDLKLLQQEGSLINERQLTKPSE